MTGEERGRLDHAPWRLSQERCQNRLVEVLTWLRDNEIQSRSQLRHVAEEMLVVYKDTEFRHHYADILEVIHVFDDENQLAGSERFEQIKARGENLAAGILQLYEHECDDICAKDGPCPIAELQQDKRLHKLYDHVNLEARRASYEADLARETIDAIQKANDDLLIARRDIRGAVGASQQVIETGNKLVELTAQTKKRADEANEVASEASKKAGRLQLEMVSVLGVFSAIILAFNEGVVFSTSSISAVDTQPPYQIAFVVAIIGFILFNCLYGAFALVYRIIRPKGESDHLLPPRRIIGIELAAAGSAAFLGAFAYSNDIVFGDPQSIAAVISLVVFSIGIGAIATSGKKSDSPN